MKVATIACCCAAIAGCRNFDESFDSKGKYSKKTVDRVPAGAIRSISIDEVNGTVSFSAATGTEIIISAELVTQAPTDEKAREFAGKYEKKIEVNGGRLSIVTDYPRFMAGGYGGWINYKVTAPRGLALKIVTVNGAVTANPGASSADIETVNGPVTVSGVSGELKAATVNGSVEASECSGPVSIETVNGEANYTTTSAPGEIKISTVGGEINLKIPPASKSDISAETVNGSISSKLSLENSTFEKDELSGKLNGGGAPIFLETVNAAISISSSAAE